MTLTFPLSKCISENRSADFHLLFCQLLAPTAAMAALRIIPYYLQNPILELQNPPSLLQKDDRNELRNSSRRQKEGEGAEVQLLTSKPGPNVYQDHRQPSDLRAAFNG